LKETTVKATTVTQPDLIPQDRLKCLTPVDLSEDEQDSVIRMAFEVLAARHQPGTVLSSPQDTRLYLRLQLGKRKAEVFGVLFLDNRHRVLRFEEMLQGTIDGASVHPRVIVQRALEVNAAAVILCHNHPSGVAEPSRADGMLTKCLKDTLALVDIRVLDHFVVSMAEAVSFTERGLI
jgi:DNA repair protein RadC